MRDPRDIRQRFHDAVGNEAYARFTREINDFSISSGRLRFWQLKLWHAFAEPLYSTCGESSVIQHFLVCCVHGCELQSVSLRSGPVPDSGIVFSIAPRDPGEVKAQATLFPMASVRSEPTRSDVKISTGWYCQICRETEARWNSKAFKHNISDPSSPEVSLYIEQLAAKYPGDTPLAQLLRYYTRWQLPEAPDDPELLKLRNAICELNSCAVNKTPLLATQLHHAAALFSMQPKDSFNLSVLDHCKMHYIALCKIAAANENAVA
jgi:hypothetical protein